MIVGVPGSPPPPPPPPPADIDNDETEEEAADAFAPALDFPFARCFALPFTAVAFPFLVSFIEFLTVLEQAV